MADVKPVRGPGGEAAGEAGGEAPATERRPDPETDLPRAGNPVAPVVVPRWIQLVMLPLGLLGLWALARASGAVLLILIIASTVALILNPVVRMLGRLKVPRGLAILIVYVGGIRVPGWRRVLLSDPISTQISRFQADVPHLVKQANKDLANVQSWLKRNGIKVQIQQQGQTALQTLQKNVLKRSGDIVSFSRDLLTQLVTISSISCWCWCSRSICWSTAEQIGGARAADHAAGRRHARGRLPAPGPAVRCSTTFAGRSCSAW